MSGAQLTTGLEIAIIGKAGRFPGARDLAAFWHNLRQGIESIHFFSAEEIAAAGGDPSRLADPAFVAAYGALGEVDLFDADFFGYSPREAAVMDPQQRIFLECAWEALEDAGYAPQRCRGSVGVYGGTTASTYLLRLLGRSDLSASLGSTQATIANSYDSLCTRVSYKLNLEGPSLTVQTACSTSLVAVHLACQALLSGECEMALAGGVAVRFPQESGYVHQEGGILSVDGHCRPFDAAASGTVGGAGVGIVVLKRLESALADGDSICALIKGSAINNDGAAKAGYTAPRMDGQAKVIRAAQMLAEVPAETISYIEAHGTATRLGDPIELAALSRAFRNSVKGSSCAIGSVKSNIGHLDAAAGVAGLLKTVLSLENSALPPSLHFSTPNPELDFAGTPFHINTELTEWRRGAAPRRAGVSSFGIGGTNAHVILEEAPPQPATTPGRPWQLLVLSARTVTALEEATDRLEKHLRSHSELDLADVAYTTQVGRMPFPVRRTLVCRDLADAAAALGARDPQRLRTVSQSSAEPPVAFLFSGLGEQYVGMGQGLYRSEPVFREEVDRAALLLAPLLGVDVRDFMYPTRDSDSESVVADPAAGQELDLRRMVRPPREEADAASRSLQRTAFAQPAMFVVQHALAQLWISWGIRPQAMIGYSLGEYVAACLAGVLSLEDALALVAQRALLIDALPAGEMLAVSLPESRVEEYLGEGLSLAAVNGVSLCVVGGALDSVEELERRLAAEGVPCRRLSVAHTFHSPQLAAAAHPLRELVGSFELRPPGIPYLSNVTGTWITASQATDPDYWVQHLCGAVRFADGIGEIWKEPGCILLEVGPGRSLGQLALQQLGDGREMEGAVLSSLRPTGERHPDRAFLLETLGRLWQAGVTVDWAAVHSGEQRRRVPLPTYPFERRRHWLETGGARPASAPAGAVVRQPVPPPAFAQAASSSPAAAPPGCVEEVLAGIWRDLLGVDQVAARDNFFNLGGDSLLAVSVGSRLQKTLGVQLSPDFLIGAPTFAGMVDMVVTALAAGSGSASPPQPSRSSCLVPMQGGDGSARRPFYLVHPVGGHVYFYRNLAAALGEGQPVYGLRALGLEEGEDVPSSIEQMAAHYIAEVRFVQPVGPYLLGGSSMGGMVAFEMAQQLRSQGQEVAVLAMMDAPGPGQMPVRPADQAELLFLLYGNWLPISVDELRRRGEDERADYLLDAARAADAIPAGVSRDHASRHLRVVAALWETMFEYQPSPYPGPILFFRARDRKGVLFHNPELAWIDLAAGTEVHVVPGDHTSMHNPPHVKALAARLRAAFDRTAVEG